jgi:dephospho-CoA kinase
VTPAIVHATLAVALTGGIATGKSATTARFAGLGAPVFDADVIARDVVAAGQPALGEIAAAFGRETVTADGELDRARVREIVFADARARRRLESIIHPRVRVALLSQIQACTATYCVLAIPLLVECRADYLWVDRVVTTDAPRATQLRRLMQRPGIDEAMAQRMLDAQATREQRLALADDVIDNTGPLQALDAAVLRLHKRYLALAAQRRPKT